MFDEFLLQMVQIRWAQPMQDGDHAVLIKVSHLRCSMCLRRGTVEVLKRMV